MQEVNLSEVELNKNVVEFNLIFSKKLMWLIKAAGVCHKFHPIIRRSLPNEYADVS